MLRTVVNDYLSIVVIDVFNSIYLLFSVVCAIVCLPAGVGLVGFEELDDVSI